MGGIQHDWFQNSDIHLGGVLTYWRRACYERDGINARPREGNGWGCCGTYYTVSKIPCIAYCILRIIAKWYRIPQTFDLRWHGNGGNGFTENKDRISIALLAIG